MKKKWLHTTFAILLLLLCMVIGCKKFIEVEAPPTSITSGAVFDKESTATAAVLSIYSRIMQSSSFLSGGYNGLSYMSGLLSDEFVNYANASANMEMATNSLQEGSPIVTTIWRQCYRYIYDANAILEGLEKSPSISEAVKAQLAAEAKFIRAWCYFHLINFYGEVPLLLTTDYTQNASAARSKVSDVYSQVISDLLSAQADLPTGYLSATNTSTTERTRPNRFAATALLSRVYLYTENYQGAETEATKVLTNKPSYDTTSLLQVFNKNSAEAIWQLMPNATGVNTFEAPGYVLTATPAPASTTGRNTALTDQLMASFEPGDRRSNTWIGSFAAGGKTYYYPNKYKVYLTGQPVTEYLMVFRVSDLYLIRAEASVKQSKVDEGLADLNVLRRRARALPTILVPSPLPDLVGLNKDQALAAIEHERRAELFAEGHRWYDLKRTNRADAVLKPIKGNNWQATDQLWPVPATEIGLNANLKPQNTGY